MIKKLLLAIFIAIPIWCWTQEYRLVSIPLRYQYAFNDGYADGTGTCTSCWTYANRYPRFLVTETLEGIQEPFLTDKTSLSVSFYEYQSKTISKPFDQQDYCTGAQYKSKDEFTGKQVGYCQARMNREDVVLKPGSVVTLGNALSENLSDPDHKGALSALKVWMLPNITSYKQSLGYCEPIFAQPGGNVAGGHWEYLLDESTSWNTLDGEFASRYPLDVSLETLDESTSGNMRGAQFLKLRFVLNAEGGGDFGGFHTASTSSTTEVPGTGTAVLGPYSFTLYRCSPDLSELPITLDVRCNGESSGSFTLRFGRELYSDYKEKMLLMLYKFIGQEFVFLESKTLLSGDLKGSTYSWSNTLDSGRYKVRWMTKEGGDDPESIPDAFKESDPFIIGEPPPLQGSAEGKDVLCKGDNTGQITVEAQGGVSPYRYAIDGITWQSDPVFSDLEAGAYEVQIQDDNACEYVLAIALEEPSSNITATLMLASDPTAFGEKDGAVNMLVSGGTPPYSFEWKQDGEIVATEEDLVNMGAGSYTFQARDANGCSTPVYAFELIAPDPLGLIFLVEKDSLSCAEETTVLRARGTGSASEWDDSYTYRWANGSEDPVITDAGGGSYEITVYDKYGNSFTASHELYAPEPLRVVSDKNDVLCKGLDNGSIRLEIEGGTPPYLVQWSRLEDTAFTATGPELNGIPYGNYVYRIVDANGCTLGNMANPVAITQPREEMTLVEVNREEITAYGAEDGGLRVSITGGTAPYRYEWIGPDGFMATTPEISGLKEGVYTLMVADQNAGEALLTGCYLIEEFELQAPDPLAVSIAVNAPVSCHQSMDAVLQGAISGGVMPYELQWFQVDQDGENIPVGTGDYLDGIGAGVYFLRCTDRYGNTENSEFLEVKDPDLLEIAVSELINVSCAGGHDGAIKLTIAGGVTPYQVVWSNGTTGTTNADLAPGSYEVDITDANGCSIQEAFTIETLSDLHATLQLVTRPSGVNALDGEVRIEVSGGAPPYEVHTNGSLLRSGPETLFDISGLAPGVYNYAVVDTQGCSWEGEITLSAEEWLQLDITPPSCAGLCDGAVNVVVSETLGEYDLIWKDGDHHTFRTGMCPGSYSFTLLVQGEEPQTYVVEIPEANIPDPGIPVLIYLCSGSQTVLQPDTTLLGYDYEWYLGGELITTASSLTLVNEGAYELRIKGEACSWIFPFSVQFTDEVQVPEFVMATDVLTGEEVLAIDVTVPVPEQVTWQLPEEAKVTQRSDDGVSFYFEAAGEYEITMHVSRGSCKSTVMKKIRVNEPDPATANLGISGLWITDPKIYPNPVASYFNLEVELHQEGPLSVKVYSLANNQMISQVSDAGKRRYRKQIEVAGAPPGLYAVLIETALGSRVYKVVKT